MSKATKKTTPAAKSKAVQPVADEKTIVMHFTDDVLTKMKSVLEFEDEAAFRAVVADAINTYVVLGTLKTQGSDIFVRNKETEKSRRLRLPFEAPQAA